MDALVALRILSTRTSRKEIIRAMRVIRQLDLLSTGAGESPMGYCTCYKATTRLRELNAKHQTIEYR